MTERQQFQRALDILYSVSLPNEDGHKPASVILDWLFQELNATDAGPVDDLDDEHRRWLYEWAREQWEDMPALGAAPKLEPR